MLTNCYFCLVNIYIPSRHNWSQLSLNRWLRKLVPGYIDNVLIRMSLWVQNLLPPLAPIISKPNLRERFPRTVFNRCQRICGNYRQSIIKIWREIFYCQFCDLFCASFIAEASSAGEDNSIVIKWSGEGVHPGTADPDAIRIGMVTEWYDGSVWPGPNSFQRQQKSTTVWASRLSEGGGNNKLFYCNHIPIIFGQTLNKLVCAH